MNPSINQSNQPQGEGDCLCETCKLGRAILAISEKCSAEEKAALSKLWDRMENAETDLDMIIGMAQDGEDLALGGKIYRASDKAPIQQMLRGEPGRN